MHTTVLNGRYRVHHNGDYSGDCILVDGKTDPPIEFGVPCGLPLYFAAEFTRDFVGGLVESAGQEGLLPLLTHVKPHKKPKKRRKG